MLFRRERATEYLRKADAARDALDWGSAAYHYKNYLQVRPDDAGIWIQLGHAYKEAGKLDDAELAYLRGLVLAPQSADAHLQVGHLFKIRQDNKRAVLHYRLSHELDPGSPHAANELAALGAPLEFKVDADESLHQRLDRLDHEIGSLRSRSEPIVLGLSHILSNASSLQSMAFKLASQEKQVKSRLGQIDSKVETLLNWQTENANIGECMRMLEGDLQRLLGAISDGRAVNHTVSALKREVADLDAQVKASQAALHRMDEVEALAQKLAASLKALVDKHDAAQSEAASWGRSIEARFGEITTAMAAQASASKNSEAALATWQKGLQTRLEGVDDMPNKLAALGEQLSRRIADGPEARAVALTGALEALSQKINAAEGDALAWRRMVETRVDELGAALAREAAARTQSETTRRTWEAELQSQLDAVGTFPGQLATLGEQLSRQLTESADTRMAALARAINDANTKIGDLDTRLKAGLTEPGMEAQKLASLLSEPPVSETLRAHLTAQLASTEALAERDRRMAAIEARLGAVPPAVADQLSEAVARIHAAENRAARAETGLKQANEMLAYLVGRVEFVRREMMFEFRHGRAKPDLSALTVETRVISTDKFEAQRSAPRLNLGCGHITVDGYLNVDRRELPGVDIVAEADKLPFQSGEVAEIRSAHLLEHFPQEELKRSLLPYWLDLLKPGGLFVAVVPDLAEMVAATSRGEYEFAAFREVFFGAQDYIGDYHYNMFTPESLQALLAEAGYENPQILARGHRNGACFEFEIAARRSKATRGGSTSGRSRKKG